MLTQLQLIVVISISVSGTLFVALLGLFVRLRRLKQSKNEEYNYLREHVIRVPNLNDKRQRATPNRLFPTMHLAGQRSLSESNLAEASYVPMSVGIGGSTLLQVPSFNNSSSGSDSSLAVTSADSDPNNDGSVSDNPEDHAGTLNSELPLIDFRINYFSATQTLNVTIVQLRNIPVQFRKNCSSYVKISLKAINKIRTKRYKTKTVRNSLNPVFDEELSFVNYPFDDLKNSYRIRFSCYAKSRKLSKKTLVGDLVVQLSRPDFEVDSLLSCSERLSAACPVTGRRGPQLTAADHGFLQVELSFVQETRRMKIMIRKGQNLKTNSSGIAEFYVICTVLRNGNALAYKETRPALGAQPVWNQAFLFYLDEADSHEYWCQLLLMKGRTFSKDGAVGQVVLGCEAGLSGRAQWNEATEHGDVIKWHAVLPISTGCM